MYEYFNFVFFFGVEGIFVLGRNERWGVDTVIVSFGVRSGSGINIVFENYYGTRIKINVLNCKFVLRIEDSKHNIFVLYVLRIVELYFLPTQVLNSIYSVFFVSPVI